jgi:hypothetical protein
MADNQKPSDVFQTMLLCISPGHFRPQNLRRTSNRATVAEKKAILEKIVRQYNDNEMTDEKTEKLILAVLMSDQKTWKLDSEFLQKLMKEVNADTVMGKMFFNHSIRVPTPESVWRDLKMDRLMLHTTPSTKAQATSSSSTVKIVQPTVKPQPAQMPMQNMTMATPTPSQPQQQQQPISMEPPLHRNSPRTANDNIVKATKALANDIVSSRWLSGDDFKPDEDFDWEYLLSEYDQNVERSVFYRELLGNVEAYDTKFLDAIIAAHDKILLHDFVVDAMSRTDLLKLLPGEDDAPTGEYDDEGAEAYFYDTVRAYSYIKNAEEKRSTSSRRLMQTLESKLGETLTNKLRLVLHDRVTHDDDSVENAYVTVIQDVAKIALNNNNLSAQFYVFLLVITLSGSRIKRWIHAAEEALDVFAEKPLKAELPELGKSEWKMVMKLATEVGAFKKLIAKLQTLYDNAKDTMPMEMDIMCHATSHDGCGLLAESEHRCAYCNEPATLRCSGCRAVYYCSELHQQQHWYSHSAVCRQW